MSHRIEWLIEDTHIFGKVICDEPEGADCRLTCREDCDQWGPLIRNEDGVFHEWAYPEDEGSPLHHMESTYGYCNVAEYLNAESAPEDLYAGAAHPVVDGPIEVEWDSALTTYIWSYEDES